MSTTIQIQQSRGNPNEIEEKGRSDYLWTMNILHNFIAL